MNIFESLIQINMKKLYFLVSLVVILTSCNPKNNTKDQIKTREPNSFAIVIHGGAGGIKREYFTEEQQEAYKLKLEEALKAGYSVLEISQISSIRIVSISCIRPNIENDWIFSTTPNV